jgi:hypothetical protein
MNASQRWTNAILEQDDSICQNCGTSKHLDAAHIEPKSRRPDLKYDPANGITLCRSCHKFFHDHPYEFELFIDHRQQRGARKSDFIQHDPTPRNPTTDHRLRKCNQPLFTDQWIRKQNEKFQAG